MAGFLNNLFGADCERSDLCTLLQSTPIFEALTPRELRRIESILHERSFLANEIVFEQGEEGLGLYVVRSGRVRISRVEAGQDREIAVLGRGSFFGELALLDNAPRAAQARAIEATDLIGFYRPDLTKLFDTDPRIAAKVSSQLAKWIGRRLRDSIQRNATPSSIQSA